MATRWEDKMTTNMWRDKLKAHKRGDKFQTNLWGDETLAYRRGI